MAEEEIKSLGKLTEDQFNKIASSFSLDLIALFSLIQEDVNKLVIKATEEGWQPERLIQEISDLI